MPLAFFGEILMIENETINLVGFVILAFSLIFAYTGTLSQCTYRKYIVPAMLLVIAVIFLQEMIAALMIAVSATLFYSGYKGYGIEVKKKEAEKTKNETKEEKTEEI